MARFIFCSECGVKKPIIRKALPKYGRIIDMIEPHECLEEPLPFDLAPVEVPDFVPSEKKKGRFSQQLDELQPIRGLPLSSGLKDLRPENVVIKSSAPPNLLDNIARLQNSISESDLEEPSKEPDDTES